MAIKKFMDAVRSRHRKAVSQRLIGEDKRCATCGEARAGALIRGSEPTTCFNCDRKKQQRTTLDHHHVAGQANSPLTFPVPANDHRAELSAAQYDWPKETRENKNHSPLRAAAASIRGWIDTSRYLCDRLSLPFAEQLEHWDGVLQDKFGPKWPLEILKLPPWRKTNGRSKN